MTRRTRRTGPNAQLDALIEEALVDAYNDEERFEAWVVTFEEHLKLPARALVIGEEVTVTGFDREPEGEVLAKCRRKGLLYKVNATALEWPNAAPPKGFEWFDAYRKWLRRA